MIATKVASITNVRLMIMMWKIMTLMKIMMIKKLMIVVMVMPLLALKSFFFKSKL